jgi:hypothetical protein
MKRHPFDAWSFAFGALFLVVAGILASNRFDVLDLSETNLVPVVVLALGGALLVGAIAGARSEGRGHEVVEPGALATSGTDSAERDQASREESSQEQGTPNPSDEWAVAATDPISRPSTIDDAERER